MALIQPNSTIKIYHGMPLDKSYQDTLYFANKGAQYSWFSSSNNNYLKYTFDNNTYQRVNSGVFECSQSADNLYDCNYMAFKNTAYGSKWFFAFITSVEYRNDGNSYVYYELDYIQTYLYDGVVLEDCLIEREHTATDAIGDNILPEPVSVGEYVFASYHQLLPSSGLSPNVLQEYLIGILVCAVGSGATVECNIYDEVFMGGYIAVYPTNANALTNLEAKLQTYVNAPDSIVCIYMMPRLCVGANVTIPDGGAQLASTYHGQSVSASQSAIVGNETFGSYTPKNKKLYTYPYNFLHVDNGNGDSQAYRYEFFPQLTPNFTIESCVAPPVQVKLMPVNYKGASGNTAMNADFLTITGYPMGSWNYDAYKAWVAQNAVPMIIRTGASALGIVAGVLASPVTGGASLALAGVSAVNLVGNTLSANYQASNQADICKGNVASGNVNFSHQEMQYYAGRCHITQQQAKAIDDYFTQFGYKVNRLGTPSIHNRPHYTYVKTIGCKVKGLAPGDAIEKIESVFNNGITFWVTPSEVGNYSVNNAPT